MSVDVRPPLAARAAADPLVLGGRAAYGPVLALTVTLALACCLLLISGVLLVVHPPGSGFIATVVIGQNQRAKTVLYLVAFAVVLPLALVAVPRVADRIARGPNSAGLPFLAGLFAATLPVAILFVKLSGALPWGDGLGVVLAAIGVWAIAAGSAIAMAARPRPWGALLRGAPLAPSTALLAGLLVLGTLLCVTGVGSLSVPALLVAGAVAVAALVAYGRVRMPPIGRLPGGVFDVVAAVVLLLAIPNVVVFASSGVVPSPYFEPGIIQFQQDWILGPTSQLLHGGGALLVNVPSSQYGVGLVYFLAAWFHIAAIGYGTFGLLDGILTALLYVAGYVVLRIAGATRLLTASALALGVVVLLYNLHFQVGELPEQGPLRFGLPMLLVLALTVAARWPRRAAIARVGALLVLGVSSVWAVEAFAYTAFTFVAMIAVEAWLRGGPGRLRWLSVQLGLAVGACVCAHLILAGTTLAATSHLPHWGQYLAFVRALILGGREGSITYGFANWSPGLAMGAGCLASGAALVLLLTRSPGTAAARRIPLIALAGVTAYAIASFSYTDNRSSTYLLLYVALPVLMAGALWLGLLLGQGAAVSPRLRLGGLAFALSVAVLMVAAAWPSVPSRFSNTALAHAYPGGGLGGAVRRLWRNPAFDPRAPEGARLVRAYIPGRRALILLPDANDLAIEILMRSGRSSPLFFGDPSQDAFVPAVWKPKIGPEIDALRPGQRLLTDKVGLAGAVPAGNPQLNWIIQRLEARFRLFPVHEDGNGLIVAQLLRR